MPQISVFNFKSQKGVWHIISNVIKYYAIRVMYAYLCACIRVSVGVAHPTYAPQVMSIIATSINYECIHVSVS